NLRTGCVHSAYHKSPLKTTPIFRSDISHFSVPFQSLWRNCTSPVHRIRDRHHESHLQPHDILQKRYRHRSQETPLRNQATVGPGLEYGDRPIHFLKPAKQTQERPPAHTIPLQYLVYCANHTSQNLPRLSCRSNGFGQSDTCPLQWF